MTQRRSSKPFVQILHPVAPHITEEIWRDPRPRDNSLRNQPLGRTYDERHLVEATRWKSSSTSMAKSAIGSRSSANASNASVGSHRAWPCRRFKN
ncbi:MAG: class I tRNA ligase family protein [Bacillus subtilis]|nr:class I tRNA ligase family protein [Bacillus subtilis]